MKTLLQRSAYVLSCAILVFAVVLAVSPHVRAQVSSYLTFDTAHNLKVAVQNTPAVTIVASTPIPVTTAPPNSTSITCTSGCGAPLTGAAQNVAPAANQSIGMHLSRIGDGALDALQPSVGGTYLTQAITSSGSPQSVTVTNNSSGLLAVNSYVWIGGIAEANTEYVKITAEADTNHITAIFAKNHSNGDIILPAGALDFKPDLYGIMNGSTLRDMPVQGSAAILFAYNASGGGSQFDKVNSDGSGDIDVNLMLAGHQVKASSDQGNADRLATASNSQGPTQPIVCDKSYQGTLTATTQIIANSNVTYFCSLLVIATGTSPSFQFEQAAGGSSCATSVTALSPVFTPTSGTPVAHGSGIGTLFRTANNFATCVVVGGTSPSIEILASYAQF